MLFKSPKSSLFQIIQAQKHSKITTVFMNSIAEPNLSNTTLGQTKSVWDSFTSGSISMLQVINGSDIYTGGNWDSMSSSNCWYKMDNNHCKPLAHRPKHSFHVFVIFPDLFYSASFFVYIFSPGLHSSFSRYATILIAIPPHPLHPHLHDHFHDQHPLLQFY